MTHACNFSYDCSVDVLRTGVIAVAVYGLYGAATQSWDISMKIHASGAFDAFWETIAFIVNGIIFFYSGVACINFIVRHVIASSSWYQPVTVRSINTCVEHAAIFVV